MNHTTDTYYLLDEIILLKAIFVKTLLVYLGPTLSTNSTARPRAIVCVVSRAVNTGCMLRGPEDFYTLLMPKPPTYPRATRARQITQAIPHQHVHPCTAALEMGGMAVHINVNADPRGAVGSCPDPCCDGSRGAGPLRLEKESLVATEHLMFNKIGLKF